MTPSTIIANAYPYLHAINSGNLAGWTEADLYVYLTQSVRQQCADASLLGQVYEVAVLAGATSVALPATTSAIVQAQWNGQTLRARTVTDMDARLSDWQDQPGDTPEVIIVDQQGLNVVRLYPKPFENGTFRAWIRLRPADQNSGSSLVVSQSADLVAFFETISEARRKGGRFAMPEAAQGAQLMSDVLKAASRIYLGGSV